MRFLKEKRMILLIMIPILVGVISFFPVANYAASTEFHRNSIEALEEKEKTVLELTTAATAASALVTLLPGDVATPIADKLADVSSGFLIVLCALYLEKYLLTITGYAAFKVLIPIACVLYVVHVIVAKEAVARLARKLLIFALAIFIIIPSGIKVSDLIEDTYQASIETTIETAKDLTENLGGLAEQPPEDSGEKNWYQTFKDWTVNMGSTVKTTLSDWLERAETVVSNLFEALAVMIVTCCIIPILVLMGFVWILKMVFSVELPVADAWKRKKKKTPDSRSGAEEEMCLR